METDLQDYLELLEISSENSSELSDFNVELKVLEKRLEDLEDESLYIEIGRAHV